MSTINLTNTNANNAVPVKAGQYLICCAGVGGGDEADLFVNIGETRGVPITTDPNAFFTEEGCQVVWLPDCTVWAAYNGGSPEFYSMSMAPLATELK